MHAGCVSHAEQILWSLGLPQRLAATDNSKLSVSRLYAIGEYMCCICSPLTERIPNIQTRDVPTAGRQVLNCLRPKNGCVLEHSRLFMSCDGPIQFLNTCLSLFGQHLSLQLLINVLRSTSSWKIKNNSPHGLMWTNSTITGPMVPAWPLDQAHQPKEL